MENQRNPEPATSPACVAISDVRFVAAGEEEVATGLIGWTSFTIAGQLRLDSIQVRKTLENRYALSFPSRKDAAGRTHHIVKPIGDEARRHLEREILGALGLAEAGR